MEAFPPDTLNTGPLPADSEPVVIDNEPPTFETAMPMAPPLELTLAKNPETAPDVRFNAAPLFAVIVTSAVSDAPLANVSVPNVGPLASAVPPVVAIVRP